MESSRRIRENDSFNYASNTFAYVQEGNAKVLVAEKEHIQAQAVTSVCTTKEVSLDGGI
jgi:hypothetical protein